MTHDEEARIESFALTIFVLPRGSPSDCRSAAARKDSSVLSRILKMALRCRRLQPRVLRSSHTAISSIQSMAKPSTPPSAPRKRADAQRNRDAIVEVAIRHFREKGVQASLEEVAREVGVGIGTLYRNFPNREAILAVALEQKNSELLAAARSAQDDADPATGLASWVEALHQYLRTFNGLPTPVMVALGETTSPLSVTCVEILDITAVLVDRGIEAGVVNPITTAKTLFQCILGTAWALNYGAGDEASERAVRGLIERGYRI